MSESSAGLIALAGVTAVCAVLVHWRIRRYVVASMVAAVSAAVVLQALITLQLGHIDPFAPVAFVLSLLVTTPLAFLVGWLFLLRRRANAVSDASPRQVVSAFNDAVGRRGLPSRSRCNRSLTVAAGRLAQDPVGDECLPCIRVHRTGAENGSIDR